MKRRDVFEHLTGCPEENVLRIRAREMYWSDWWRTVSRRDEPSPVAGEIEVAR